MSWPISLSSMIMSGGRSERLGNCEHLENLMNDRVTVHITAEQMDAFKTSFDEIKNFVCQ